IQIKLQTIYYLESPGNICNPHAAIDWVCNNTDLPLLRNQFQTESFTRDIELIGIVSIIQWLLPHIICRLHAVDRIPRFHLNPSIAISRIEHMIFTGITSCNSSVMLPFFPKTQVNGVEINLAVIFYTQQHRVDVFCSIYALAAVKKA